MSEAAARIRWEPNGDDRLIGYVGTYPDSAFLIYAPSQYQLQWLLSCRIPCPGNQLSYENSEGEAKARAETRLEEFVTSLGAVYPEGDGWPGRGWAYAGRDRDGNLTLKHEESGGLYHVIPEEDL